MGLLQQIELELLLIKMVQNRYQNIRGEITRCNIILLYSKLDLAIFEVPVVVASTALAVSFQHQPFAVAKIDLQTIRNDILRMCFRRL